MNVEDLFEAISEGFVGGEHPCVLTSGIAGCGAGTRVSAGRWSVVHPTLSCFIELEIGNFTSIASGLKIVSGQHPPVEHPECLSSFPFAERWGVDYPPSKFDGVVRIGHDVWIGEDVHILEGITIGDGAIVGACSVVAHNVPPYSVVVGNPSGIKRYRFSPTVIKQLCELRWWDWSDEEIRYQMPMLTGKRITAALP